MNTRNRTQIEGDMNISKLCTASIVRYILALLLTSLAVAFGSAWDITPVLRVPQEFPSIQVAVNAAPNGATILIAPGIYSENVTITKSLTLQGSGREKTFIKGKEELKPVLLIENSMEIDVVLEDLTLTKGHVHGIRIKGKAAVVLNNLAVFGNRGSGIWIESSRWVTLQHSVVSDNQGDGITVAGSHAEVSIISSQISGNGGDNSGSGLRTVTGYQNRLHIFNSTVAGNALSGLDLGADSGVEVQESWVSDNGRCGIEYQQSFIPYSHNLSGRNNWVQNNAKNLCNARPSPGFLRSEPPQPLLTTAEVCSQGCAFTAVGPAIWATRSGGVIRIRDGIYQGLVVLAKDLTLQGSAHEQVTFVSFTPATVQIGGSAHVKLQDLQIAGYGQQLGGEALWIYDSATVWLRNSVVSHHGFGLLVESSANVTVENSSITQNKYGLWMQNGTATFQNSTFSENLNGLSVMEGRLSLLNSEVSGNGINGLSLLHRVVVNIYQSVIENNGTDSACQYAGPGHIICSGLEVSSQTRLRLQDSVLRNNTDWGLAALLKQCGYDADLFTGEVIFEDNNVIEGNNKLGKLNGMGNPGNHPFKDLPDGQVCLP